MRLLFVFLLLCFTNSTLQAHHSFAAYDTENLIYLEGKIAEFQFSSPHILLKLAVTGDEGEVVVWDLESSSPNRWDGYGYTRDLSAIENKMVTILGAPQRDGTPYMTLSALTPHETGEFIFVQPHGHSGLPTEPLIRPRVRGDRTVVAESFAEQANQAALTAQELAGAPDFSGLISEVTKLVELSNLITLTIDNIAVRDELQERLKSTRALADQNLVAANEAADKEAALQVAIRAHESAEAINEIYTSMQAMQGD